MAAVFTIRAAPIGAAVAAPLWQAPRVPWTSGKSRGPGSVAPKSPFRKFPPPGGANLASAIRWHSRAKRGGAVGPAKSPESDTFPSPPVARRQTGALPFSAARRRGAFTPETFSSWAMRSTLSLTGSSPMAARTLSQNL